MNSVQLSETQQELRYSLQRLVTYALRAEAALCDGHEDRTNEYLLWLGRAIVDVQNFAEKRNANGTSE